MIIDVTSWFMNWVKVCTWVGIVSSYFNVGVILGWFI